MGGRIAWALSRPIVTSTLAAATLSTLVGLSFGCIGGNCSKKPPEVSVEFAGGFTPDDVAVFTASGACGPAPSVCKDPARDACDAAGAPPYYWSAVVPAVAAGACAIHVQLKHGEVFDDSVTVKYSSDCGGGYFVDYGVIVRFASFDGGATD
jgi:hypothetical protein